jgi:hypothetical protein
MFMNALNAEVPRASSRHSKMREYARPPLRIKSYEKNQAIWRLERPGQAGIALRAVTCRRAPACAASPMSSSSRRRGRATLPVRPVGRTFRNRQIVPKRNRARPSAFSRRVVASTHTWVAVRAAPTPPSPKRGAAPHDTDESDGRGLGFFLSRFPLATGRPRPAWEPAVRGGIASSVTLRTRLSAGLRGRRSLAHRLPGGRCLPPAPAWTRKINVLCFAKLTCEMEHTNGDRRVREGEHAGPRLFGAA